MTATAPPASAALAAALAANRAHFNARVAEARHHHPTFDTEAFAAFLLTGVDSVAQSVATVAPDRTASVVTAAYDVALELVAQGLAGPGARYKVVEQAWALGAPRCARLVVVQPGEVLGALSNAAVYVATVAGARPYDWLDDMARLAGHAQSFEQLLLLGQVAAWRAGLAQFREGALQAADALPPPLALMALGADAAADPAEWPRVRNAHRADPWWCAPTVRREAIRQGMELGQFSGFGGTFTQPPQVRAAGRGFVVRSADRFSLLMADAYGGVLLPSSTGEFEHAGIPAHQPKATLHGTQLLASGRSIDLDLPADGLAFAENEHTIAVTSPYSYAIRVYPRS